ncbi:class I SAM-dependent methyltransferase [Planctomycetota bacterium]|nr:class I SAM-dependent methyltransferase [Planctomycetota bacterium]
MVSNDRSFYKDGGDKVKVELGAVQETLVLPLWARARELDERRPILRDEVAKGVLERMDYDFSKLDGSKYYQVVMAARHHAFDQYVKKFLKRFPEGTVVEIGCGLSTRYERLDNGKVKWFDIDLEDTIAVRRRFFEDGERHWTLVGSIAERDWIDEVKRKGDGPFMLVSEAVLMYFEVEEVKKILSRFADEFDGGWLAFDSLSPWIHQLQQDEKFKFMEDMAAKFKWSCKDMRVVEGWDNRLHLVEKRYIPEVGSLAFKRLPMKAKFLERYVIPKYGHSQVSRFRIERSV